MRQIEYSTAFKKDYKRESKGQHKASLDNLLRGTLTQLAADEPLAQRMRDHELTGNWIGFRECHLKPDLLLIYKKSGSTSLMLARLGSHSQLF